MARTLLHAFVLLPLISVLLFGQLDPLAEGAEAHAVFERALASESREQWEVLLGLGLEVGGFGGTDAAAIREALLVRWLTERWALEVGAPDRQALVDAIATANTQYLFVYDTNTQIYQQDSIGDYLLRDSSGYLDPGGEREAWLDQVGTVSEVALEAWRTQTHATYLELLSAEGIAQSSSVGQAVAASIAQYQQAVERDFTALIVRRERQVSYMRLQDTLSARREGESQSAREVTDDLVGATQVGLVEVTEALAAAVPDPDSPDAVTIDPEEWQESFRRQFETGLEAWGQAEDRFVAERLAWEIAAQEAYAEAEAEWDQAFIEFGAARESWFSRMNEILAAGQTAWSQTLDQFAANVQDELASLAAAQAEEQAARAAEAQAYLAAFEQASGVLAMAEESITYLEEREADLVAWKKATIRQIDDRRAQIEAIRAPEYQAQADIERWSAERARINIEIGRQGASGADEITSGGAPRVNVNGSQWFVTYGQAGLRIDDEIAAAQARKNSAIASTAGEIANLRAAIESAQAQIAANSDLELVQQELLYWHGSDGTGGIVEQFGTIKQDAYLAVMDFVGRISNGLLGASSVEQEQYRLTQLVAMLEDEQAIAQAVADYAADISSDRATRAETAEALTAANAQMAAAQSAYSNAIAELEALSAGDVTATQAAVATEQAALVALHAQLSEAKQQMETALVAFRLQDTSVFTDLLTGIDEAAIAFLSTGVDEQGEQLSDTDYEELMNAYFGPAWQTYIIEAIAGVEVAVAELVEGDETEGIAPLVELIDYRASLTALDLSNFDPAVTIPTEFETYLLTTVGLEALDPTLTALTDAYAALSAAADHERAAQRAVLAAVHNAAIVAIDYEIQVRERALEFVQGRYAADGSLLADTAPDRILTEAEAAALDAQVELEHAQAQLSYHVATLAAQLAVNDALATLADTEADRVADLQATATTAEADARDAAAVADTAEADRVAAETALATAQTGGDPAEIAAATEALALAEAALTAATDAASEAQNAADAARLVADQAAAALTNPSEPLWPEPELVTVLTAAVDTTDAAGRLALDLYLARARTLDASTIAEIQAAYDLLATADDANVGSIEATLADAQVFAATAHRGQFATGSADLLDGVVEAEYAALLAAAATSEALESYGRHGYAWLELSLRETITGTNAAIANFAAAVDAAATAPIDPEIVATAFTALIEADAPDSVIEALGMYVRALAAEGSLAGLDEAAIAAIAAVGTDEALERAEAHSWVAAYTGDPDGASLANMAKIGLADGVILPDALKLTAATYRQILDASIAPIALADDFRANGDLADYQTRALDLPAEEDALEDVRIAFLSAEAAYRDALVQRIVMETERVAYEHLSASAYQERIADLQETITGLKTQVQNKEDDLTDALAAFTEAADRYADQAAAVAAAEAVYDEARLAVRVTEAIDDYARSGAVETAPDAHQALARANQELAAANDALQLIENLANTQVTDASRDAQYQTLVDAEAAQLQVAQETGLAAEALAEEIAELEATVQDAESNALRFLHPRGELDGTDDWLELDLSLVDANRLHGRGAEFSNYEGYTPTPEDFTADMASWYLGLYERGGSGFLRTMAVALYYEMNMAQQYTEAQSWTAPSGYYIGGNPYWFYLNETPAALQNYDTSPFENDSGNLRRLLSDHILDGNPASVLIERANIGLRNNYSKNEARRNALRRAKDEWNAVRGTAEYQFLRLLVATGNYTTQLGGIIDKDIQAHVVETLRKDGRDAKKDIARARKKTRKKVQRALNGLPEISGAGARNRLLESGTIRAALRRREPTEDRSFVGTVSQWRSATARLAELRETVPTEGSVIAEINAYGSAAGHSGIVTDDVRSAVRHVLDNGTASQTASIAAVIEAANEHIVETLAQSDAMIDTRAAELTALAEVTEQEYLSVLGRYIEGEATDAELEAAAAKRYSDPAFDVVDHLEQRTDNVLAVTSRSDRGEIARLQALVSRALDASATADAAYRTELVHSYTIDQEQLQRNIDRWSQETTNLVNLAVDEWNQSATRIEGRRVRWRQETEERYAEVAQLWDLRHAQLTVSREQWLEDSTRSAMVAGSHAIAVQWDLEAGALIADAESAIIPAFGADTPDLAALVEDATDNSTLTTLIERAAGLQQRAADTNVVVAAYLPTIGTGAAEASTARAVSQDLFDQVTERAAVLAAIQAREQFATQHEAMEEGIDDANQSVADSLADQMQMVGYQRHGAVWRRRITIDESLFGGAEYETHEVATYRDFTSPGFRGSVDLSDQALAGLSGLAIFTLVDKAADEMQRYQVLVFGRSDDQKTEGHEDFVQAASADEFHDALGAILQDAEAAWRQGAGYRRTGENDEGEEVELHSDTEGLFNFHVGYAPVMKSNKPEEIKEAGYGQMGRIMGQFMINEARMARGLAAIQVPTYRKPLWDDDRDNDGDSDGLFGAPSIASVVDIGLSVALSFTGLGPLAVAALSMVDDAVFAVADVGTGYQSADQAFGALGKRAAMSAVTVGIGAGSSALDGVIGTAGKFSEVATDVALKATEMVATNAASSIIHNGFDGDALWGATFGTDALKGYGSGLTTSLIASTMETGIVGTVSDDLEDARATGALIGGLAGSAVQYGLTGSTTLNVLNVADFIDGEANAGLLELNLGGNSSLLNLGQGGTNVSVSAIGQAYDGLGVYRRSREIRQEGFRGEEGVAMRMLASLGEDETTQLYEELMAGTASFGELDTSGAQAKTEQNADDTKTIYLGDDAYGDTPFGLGITLAHEAFRDGVVSDEQIQRAETTRAVEGHVDAAAAVMAGYGMRSISKEQREEVQVVNTLRAIEEQTGATGLVEQYANSAYDSSADYWRLTADGRLEITEDGWLKDENDEYILNEDGERIGSEGIETGLLNILYGQTSGRSYDSFSAEQQQATHQMLDDSGFDSYLKGPEGDLGSYWWDLASNDGKSIGTDMLAGYDLPGASNSGLLNGGLHRLFANMGFGSVTERVAEIGNGLEQNASSLWGRITAPRQQDRPGLFGRINNAWDRLWGNGPETPELAGFVPEGWSADQWSTYQQGIQNFDGDWPVDANGVQCDCADTGFMLFLQGTVEAGLFDSVEEAAAQFEYDDWHGNRQQVTYFEQIQAEDFFQIDENFVFFDRPTEEDPNLWDSPFLVPGTQLVYSPPETTPLGEVPNYTGHIVTIQNVHRNADGSVYQIDTLEGHQNSAGNIIASQYHQYNINDFNAQWLNNLGQDPGWLILEGIGLPNPF